MDVTLKYGAKGLAAQLPHTPNFKGILKGQDPPALSTPIEAVEQSLLSPIDSPALSHLAKDRKKAVIVISDITRPVPNSTLLPPMLKTLEQGGIARDDITILIATGIHRPNLDDELIRLVGAEIAESYRCVNHYSMDDDSMTYVGDISHNNESVAVYVNRIYLNADLKILTGFIEPHMWAGFSGGRKSILPGISSIKTVKYMHGPEMVADPNTRYGLLKGNPFHQGAIAIMKKAGADFIVNVTLNGSKEITGVFSGDPIKAHEEGAAFLASHCGVTLNEPLDFIITSNAGAPLDCNLYQTSKGIAAAAPALKPGGTLCIASACSEGLGSGEFQQTLDQVTTSEEFLTRLKRRDFNYPDQWCAQQIYEVRLNHPIWLATDGIDPETLQRLQIEPVSSLEKAVEQLLQTYGEKAHWAVVPDGPLVILNVKDL